MASELKDRLAVPVFVVKEVRVAVASDDAEAAPVTELVNRDDQVPDGVVVVVALRVAWDGPDAVGVALEVLELMIFLHCSTTSPSPPGCAPAAAMPGM